MTIVSADSRLLFCSAAVAAFASVASQAHSAAFYLQDQSVRGLGRAYSGEVADTGASSLWWNPAAIAGGGGEVYGGEHGIFVNSTVSDAGSTITRPIPPAGLTTPVGGQSVAKDPVSDGGVPNFAVAIPVSDRFAVGFSAAAPFDFTSKYDSSSFARYQGLTTRLLTEDFQITGAMKVTSWLDVGVGVDGQYTSAHLSQALPNLSPLQPDGRTALRGDGWNVGYAVGGRAHMGAWSFGASYRSAMDHDVGGRANISGLLGPLSIANGSASAKAHFSTPWIAAFGARYRLTDKLTVDAQVQRFGWSEFNAININANGLSNVIPTNYKDSTSEAIGADYQVNDKWVMRVGFGYDQTPTPNNGRSSLVPDSDRQLYTIGTSYKIRPKMTVDAAFGYIAFNGSRLNNTAVFYPGTLARTVVSEKGSVSADAQVVSLGVRYNF